MNRSPDTDTTFFRIGKMPGSRMQMTPAQWPKCATPLSRGMSPLHREFYNDGAGRLICGIWECNAGIIDLRDCTTDGVCFTLRGTLRLTDSRKYSETFGAGECLVIPRGFNGIWSHSDGFSVMYARIDVNDDVQECQTGAT